MVTYGRISFETATPMPHASGRSSRGGDPHGPIHTSSGALCVVRIIFLAHGAPLGLLSRFGDTLLGIRVTKHVYVQCGTTVKGFTNYLTLSASQECVTLVSHHYAPRFIGLFIAPEQII